MLLPPGYMVFYEGGQLTSVIDPSDREVWSSAEADASADESSEGEPE
jgi:hypothetical protein